MANYLSSPFADSSIVSTTSQVLTGAAGGATCRCCAAFAAGAGALDADLGQTICAAVECLPFSHLPTNPPMQYSLHLPTSDQVPQSTRQPIQPPTHQLSSINVLTLPTLTTNPPT